MLRMKCSVAEKPQWARAVPNQALAADAGGGQTEAGRGYIRCKVKWLRGGKKNKHLDRKISFFSFTTGKMNKADLFYELHGSYFTQMPK